MRAIKATVTPASPQAMVRMDNYATAVLGAAIVVDGGASFMLVHSCDDPNDLVNPVPVDSMFWDHSLLPEDAYIGTANITFQTMASPLWFKLNLTNAVGSVRATFLQVGEHSHSNISAGDFAPPTIVDELPGGHNSAAGK